MTFHQVDSMRYFTFESFEDSGVVHAAITRRGGVSPKPWASMNVGGTVGDQPERVMDNRRRTFQALGRSLESLYDVWQVHGKNIVLTQAPRSPNQPHLKADAIFSDRRGVTLFMRFADCVPIFIFDPIRKVAGLVHAGWQGTVKRVAAGAVEAMRNQYSTNPADILAGIGPSIAAHHYPVGDDVIQQARLVFGDDASEFLHVRHPGSETNTVEFDLWSANLMILEGMGVRNIEISGICTHCHLEDWYSHRGENGRTGRFGALIGI